MGGLDLQNEMTGTLDMLLAGYAGGTLCRPLHALVGSHLEISPRNRAFVAALEAAKAAEIERAALRPLRSRDAALAAILSGAPASSLRKPVRAEGGLLPRALRHYLRFGDSDVPWRACSPGVREYRIEGDELADVSLLWIGEGSRLPSHIHEGQEIMLVLSGSCTEAVGRLARGDLAVIESAVPHGPIADLDSDCVCFCVADAELGSAIPARGPAQCFTRH